jgi:hypothetical protein
MIDTYNGAATRSTIPLDCLSDYIYNLTDRIASLEAKVNQSDLPLPVEAPVNVDGARRLTGYSISRLYTLCHQNKIPHHKSGGKLLFFPTELVEFIRNPKSVTL